MLGKYCSQHIDKVIKSGDLNQLNGKYSVVT